MNEIKCLNCGAVFEAEEAKCPYCGYINPEGAESKFLRELENTRKELDNVDEEAASSYVREVKKGAGSVAKIIAIALVVALVIAGGYLLLQKTVFNHDKGSYAEELVWEREHFKEYDAMFEAKEYDELMEAIANDGEEHAVYNWEHYDEFMDIADELWAGETD